MIAKMTEDHIDQVINTHIECFKDSFLTSLDRDVLSSMYNNYISSELGCAYVYIINETIIVTGTDQYESLSNIQLSSIIN